MAMAWAMATRSRQQEQCTDCYSAAALRIARLPLKKVSIQQGIVTHEEFEWMSSMLGLKHEGLACSSARESP